MMLGLAGGAALVLGVYEGWHWWNVGRFIQSTNDAYLQADQVNVAPKVSGYVEQVLVGDNQTVVVGQPLVRIDTSIAQARFDAAAAQIAQGQAEIVQTEAQMRGQQDHIAQSEAQARASLVDADFARRQTERYAPLSASGAESNEHFEQLRHNRDQSAAQSAAARAQTAEARQQLASLRAKIGVTDAQIAQARAQARSTRADLDAAVVRASIAGRIGDRAVRVGQFVQPGTRMMSVVPMQALYLVANFKETQIGRMRVGQPVAIEVDALGGRRLKGVVDSFSPGTGARFTLIPPSNATGNFTKIVQRVPVRIRLEIPEDVRPVLLPGLSVTAAVDTRDLAPAGGKAG